MISILKNGGYEIHYVGAKSISRKFVMWRNMHTNLDFVAFAIEELLRNFFGTKPVNDQNLSFHQSVNTGQHKLKFLITVQA